MVLAFVFCFSFCEMFSQAKEHTLNYNGWLMYFGSHKFSDKLGLHAEGQWRRNEVILSPQQLLLRTGINYHFSKNAFATAGYCFVETYPYGEFASKATFPEHRLWEQLQLRSLLGSVELITRLRQEQRFVNNPVYKDSIYKPGDPVYSNRTRLMTRFSFPFRGNAIVDKSFYLSLYNEIFINYGKNVGANTIDQNRAYLALGYKIPKVGRLEIGYLNQLVFKAEGIKVENNHTLQVGLSSAIDFYRKKKE